VPDCQPIALSDREVAESSEVTDRILQADGIFMSDGDQRRWMDLSWETEAFLALHVGFHLRGGCVPLATSLCWTTCCAPC
jgi:cyanophycinase-like exopeptidase